MPIDDIANKLWKFMQTFRNQLSDVEEILITHFKTIDWKKNIIKLATKIMKITEGGRETDSTLFELKIRVPIWLEDILKFDKYVYCKATSNLS